MGNQVVAGIVAEYNPFHNGHAHLIEAARAAGATHIVAVMSGKMCIRDRIGTELSHDVLNPARVPL